MGLIANVVPNAPIASAWGNAIRDATIQKFANVGERDAQWPAPPVGAACYIPGIGLMLFNGTIWVWPAGHYSARVIRVGAFTMPAAAAIFPFNTVVRDFSGSFNVATFKYVCQVAGLYIVTVSLGMQLNAGVPANVYVYKNGQQESNMNNYAGVAGTFVIPNTTHVVAAVGDTLEAWGNCSGTPSANLQAALTHMEISYIGPAS